MKPDPRFFATPSELLDAHLDTMIAARPGQLGHPLSLDRLHAEVRAQEWRTAFVTRRTRQWLGEFGRLAGRERRN